ISIFASAKTILDLTQTIEANVNTTNGNNSPILSGNNNTYNNNITINNNVSTRVKHELSKTAGIFKEPNMSSFLDQQICTAESGSQLDLIEKTTTNGITYVKVNILTGTCLNTIGWTEIVNINQTQK
ncbi:MAG: hypothetical protein LRY51_13890, partial [Geovibrio sp.]|nr:hypothetical protein [Geovibrio sp.]